MLGLRLYSTERFRRQVTPFFGNNQVGWLGRVARYLLVVAVHVAIIAAAVELAVPPAVQGDARPFYVRLVEGPAPANIETPPPPRKEIIPPRSPQLPVLTAAADGAAVSAFVVPPQPVVPAPPVEIVSAPPPALVQAHVDADYLDNPKPVYPQASRRAGEQGTVSLRVHVSVEGSVLAVETARSSGFSRLDDAARDAVSRWRFIPARRGENAVDSWVVVPVTFQLQG
jgi:protein TonB